MILTLDVETTTYNKGNPYDQRNKLVSIHICDGYWSGSYHPEDDDIIQGHVDEADLIIGFNFKFDYTWLRKHDIDFDEKRFWDVQLAHYMLTKQQHKYPSLNEVLYHYGLPNKLDVVEKEYWSKGIQTDEIPWDALCEYGEKDVELTYQAYLRQVEDFKEYPKLFKQFKLCCQDMVVLQEMEWNGLKYNKKECIEKSKELTKTIEQLSMRLAALYPGIPINFNSPNQLSAFLYGGVIKETKKEMVGFFGPTAQKAGQAKFKNVLVEHQLPRMFEPLPKSELENGCFSTDEATLKKLKTKKHQKWIIETLLEIAKLDKLNGTYYEGMNKINEEMHWPEGELHGQFNQCQTATGRLSSSKPNLQNLSGDCLNVFTTRYQ